MKTGIIYDICNSSRSHSVLDIMNMAQMGLLKHKKILCLL